MEVQRGHAILDKVKGTSSSKDISTCTLILNLMKDTSDPRHVSISLENEMMLTFKIAH